MITWSTANLPSRDRFEYWREERSKRIFGVEAEIDADRRHAFMGRISASAVGPASLVEVDVTSYTMRRTQRSIDRAPDDSFYVRQCLRGGGLTIVGDTTTQVRSGAISTGLSDTPYANIPEPGSMDPNGTVLYRAIRVPLAIVPEVMEARTKAGDDLFVRQHVGTNGIDALFVNYLASFVEQAPHLTGLGAEQAIRVLVQLALAARGIGDRRAEPVEDAIRQGLLARARKLIERDLHRTDLSPAHIASMLAISVRKLHHVFEPSGESFSRHVLAQRLARADRLMAESPEMSVTEAAYASGFDSLSTFYRGYRAAFGASPSERRTTLHRPSSAHERNGPGALVAPTPHV